MRFVYLDPTSLSQQYITTLRNDPNIPITHFSTLVLRSQPTAYWKLDDTGSTAADSSGNGNTGTLSGSITKGIIGALFNDPDTAMSFLGSGSGFIDIGTQADLIRLFQQRDFSIEYWVNPTSSPTTGVYVFSCGLFGTVGTGQFLHVGFDNSGNAKLGFFGDDLSGTTVIPANTWTYVAATWSASTKRQSIYLNGILNASRTSTGLLNVPSSSDIQIARASFSSGNGPFFFTGGIDELSIYPTVLTKDVILSHYILGALSGPQPYILTRGSDGAPDEALQQYIAGVNSLCPDLRATPLAGQSAFYVDDSTQDRVAANLKAAGAKGLWINGILGGDTGDT